jgi:hypothetical protein
MKQLRLFFMALLAVSAFGSVLAASANAAKLPLLLGQAANEPFKDKNDGTTPLQLETSSGTKIECKTAESTGVQETDTLGTFHISFKKCKGITGECKTAGDAAEEILSLGTFHYVDDFLSTNAELLGVAVLFLLSPATEFECPLVKVKVTGQLLCLVLKPLESNVTHLFHCIHKLNAKEENEGKGEQLERTWWGDGTNEEKTATLISVVNGGAEEVSSELALAEVTFPVKVAFMEE